MTSLLVAKPQLQGVASVVRWSPQPTTQTREQAPSSVSPTTYSACARYNSGTGGSATCENSIDAVVEREQHLTLLIHPAPCIDGYGDWSWTPGRWRRRSDASWRQRVGAPLTCVGAVNVSLEVILDIPGQRTLDGTTDHHRCFLHHRRYPGESSCERKPNCRIYCLPVRRLRFDAAPGDGVEQGELIPACEEENATAAVSDAPCCSSSSPASQKSPPRTAATRSRSEQIWARWKARKAMPSCLMKLVKQPRSGAEDGGAENRRRRSRGRWPARRHRAEVRTARASEAREGRWRRISARTVVVSNVMAAACAGVWAPSCMGGALGDMLRCESRKGKQVNEVFEGGVTVWQAVIVVVN
ncbi:hypothetical protein EJB05_30218, partial [Eragrostis curvula]